jgi:hypothetical protein
MDTLHVVEKLYDEVHMPIKVLLGEVQPNHGYRWSYNSITMHPKARIAWINLASNLQGLLKCQTINELRSSYELHLLWSRFSNDYYQEALALLPIVFPNLDMMQAEEPGISVSDDKIYILKASKIKFKVLSRDDKEVEIKYLGADYSKKISLNDFNTVAKELI